MDQEGRARLHGREQLLKTPNQVREAIAFHCQQAAEKYVKAVLVHCRIEFPKTHNIAQLLELLSSALPELASSLASAKALTPYGVEIRYPGDFPEVVSGEEAAAFEVASRVRDSTGAVLAPYFQSL